MQLRGLLHVSCSSGPRKTDVCKLFVRYKSDAYFGLWSWGPTHVCYDIRLLHLLYLLYILLMRFFSCVSIIYQLAAVPLQTFVNIDKRYCEMTAFALASDMRLKLILI